MVVKHHIKGYENFKEFVANLKATDDPVYIYFSGSKLPSGESWCDDCRDALPVVEEVLEKVPENTQFVYVEVGDRETWKNPKCQFRTDPNTKLLVIPTLIKWKGPQRLELDKCKKPELVAMLFEEDDD